MRRGFEGAAMAFRTVKCLALHVAGAPLCGAFLRDLSVTKLSLCVCVSTRARRGASAISDGKAVHLCRLAGCGPARGIQLARAVRSYDPVDR